VKESKED